MFISFAGDELFLSICYQMNTLITCINKDHDISSQDKSKRKKGYLEASFYVTYRLQVRNWKQLFCLVRSNMYLLQTNLHTQLTSKK